MNQHLRLPAFLPPVPTWAGGFGADRYGVFAELVLGAAVQRFRWLEPGEFVMGSPAGELGRYADEGPVHTVTIAQGFWLGETPVTQAFYEAVTGGNPSDFKKAGPAAPVEQVSWDDCQAFIQKLNAALLPPISQPSAPSTQHPVPSTQAPCFRLPSEAEWEYACRAGTAAALYAVPFSGEEGKELTTADGACPNLDPLAWYDKNAEGSTQPVKGKTPNKWGLYDMLGNVWEWCEDHWHSNYEGAPRDGSAWLDEVAKEGAIRVIRGGSWNARAGNCRCAYRHGSEPGLRWRDQGFRLVLARSSTADSGPIP